jgi:hypothetical protein
VRVHVQLVAGDHVTRGAPVGEAHLSVEALRPARLHRDAGGDHLLRQRVIPAHADGDHRRCGADRRDREADEKPHREADRLAPEQHHEARGHLQQAD